MTEYTVCESRRGVMLRIKADHEINLTSEYIHTTDENEFQKIHQSYHIGGLLSEIQEGDYWYKWYALKDYAVYYDDTPRLFGESKTQAGRISMSEDGMCEMSTDLDQRLGDLEDAICAMSDDSTAIGDTASETKEA